MKKILITLSLTLILFQNNGFSQSNTVDLYDSYKSINAGIGFANTATIDSFGLFASGTSSFGNSNFLGAFGIAHEWLSGTGLVESSFSLGLGYAIDLGNVHIVPSFGFGYARQHDWTYYYWDGTYGTLGLDARIKISDGAILNLGIDSTQSDGVRSTLFGAGLSFKVSPVSYFNLSFRGKSGISVFAASVTQCF